MDKDGTVLNKIYADVTQMSSFETGPLQLRLCNGRLTLDLMITEVSYEKGRAEMTLPCTLGILKHSHPENPHQCPLSWPESGFFSLCLGGITGT